jgi:hypothetical protein
MRMLPAAHGAFYVVSGLWPVVSLRSFERVTGPKVDGWLVKTTGGLIAAVGLALLVGARGRPTAAERTLGIGAALALGMADVVYGGAKHRISRVYLADAVVQGALAIAHGVQG